MKVFLSWSGWKSKAVAEALRDWLPNVIQALKPWMSAEDIDKGAAWDAEVANNLADAKAGVVCVTPENQAAPWLNFEAGALSKTVQRPLVCTYLVGMRPADVTGPLSRFQASEANEQQTLKLVLTLNKALGESALTESKLRESYDKWWPNLEGVLKAIPSKPSPETSRTSGDMLEEVLLLTRNLANLANTVQRRYFSDRAVIFNRHLITPRESARSIWGTQQQLPGLASEDSPNYLATLELQDEFLKGEPSVESEFGNVDEEQAESVGPTPELDRSFRKNKTLKSEP